MDAGGKFLYLVEEKRSSVRLPEDPRLPPRTSSREGPRLVPEELSFRQFVGDGRAIEPDERSARPRRVVVHGIREHFLPGAGFPNQQDGGIASTDPLRHLLRCPDPVA